MHHGFTRHFKVISPVVVTYCHKLFAQNRWRISAKMIAGELLSFETASIRWAMLSATAEVAFEDESSQPNKTNDYYVTGDKWTRYLSLRLQSTCASAAKILTTRDEARLARKTPFISVSKVAPFCNHPDAMTHGAMGIGVQVVPCEMIYKRGAIHICSVTVSLIMRLLAIQRGRSELCRIVSRLLNVIWNAILVVAIFWGEKMQTIWDWAPNSQFVCHCCGPDEQNRDRA